MDVIEKQNVLAANSKAVDKSATEVLEKAHWICSRVIGKTVLDVGCSQGINSILIAKEGFNVVGVDVDAVKIQAANHHLGQQPKEIAKKIVYFNKDFLKCDFDGQLFNTIILSEFLEQHANPEVVVDFASKCLTQDGRLIVSACNDPLNKKKSFYAIEAVKLLSAVFDIVDMEIAGCWMGLVAKKRKIPKQSKDLTLPVAIIEKIENDFYIAEKAILTALNKNKNNLHEANLKYRSATEQIALLKEKNRELSNNNDFTKKELQQLKLAPGSSNSDADLLLEQTIFLNKEIEKISAEKTQEINAHSELRSGYITLVNEHENLKQAFRELGTVNTQLDKEAQAYKDESSRAKLLEETCLTLTQQKNFAKTQSEELQLANSHLQGEMSKLLNRNELANNEIDRLTKIHYANKDVIELLYVEKNKLWRDMEDLNHKHNTDKEELFKKIHDLNSAYHHTMRQAKNLKQFQRELESKGANLQQEINCIKKGQEALDNEINRLQTLNLSLESDLEKLQYENYLVVKQYDDLDHKYQYLAQQMEQLRQEHGAAKEEIICLTEKQSSYEDVLLLNQSDKEILTKQKDQALESEIEYKSQMAKLKINYNGMVAREKRYKKELDDLTRLSERYNVEIKQYKKLAEKTLVNKIGKVGKRFKKSAKKLKTNTTEFALKLFKIKINPFVEQNAQLKAEALNVALASVDVNEVCLPCAEQRPEIKQLRVAAIMDEFTYHSYAPECQVEQLRPDIWREQIEAFKPDMLFIESAWRGIEDLWKLKISNASSELVDMVIWCRSNKVPSIFWNKEDPIHFQTFINTATLFDYVFTTDIDCIAGYKAALGHERVYLLPFACQPGFTNPIETYERKSAICFAGAYYARYPDRNNDLENFITELPVFSPVEIYDRNYGENDSNYQFPEMYQPYIIGGLKFNEIERAYKGYDYGINMNSIKQSQTMFARRVYELMASNTLVISNYSRGLKLMFGSLTLCSDAGREHVRQLQQAEAVPFALEKLKLQALRKVMYSHTYQDRLAYIESKICQTPVRQLLPKLIVFSYVETVDELSRVLDMFTSQFYPYKQLVLELGFSSLYESRLEDENIVILTSIEADKYLISFLDDERQWVAYFAPQDYYGPNYLMDLSVATRYAGVALIGKGCHFVPSLNDTTELINSEERYQFVSGLPLRSSMVQLSVISQLTVRDLIASRGMVEIEEKGLSIDPFNYYKNACSYNNTIPMQNLVDDAPLDSGMDYSTIIQLAEDIKPRININENLPGINGSSLNDLLAKRTSNALIEFSLVDKALVVDSRLEHGKHNYYYLNYDYQSEELLVRNNKLVFNLETTPGLNIQVAMLFLDSKTQRISHLVKEANKNHHIVLPENTHYIRLGLRVFGSGRSLINALLLGEKKVEPTHVITRNDTLLLTNHYPSQDDIYRNGFVHRRVLAYKDYGLAVDVYRLRDEANIGYHQYETIECITGSKESLNQLLSTGQYKSVLVHFLDESMWDVLKHYVDRVKIIVWVHGSEIQPYHRRSYNYSIRSDIQAAKLQSKKRMQFWRGILNVMPSNLHLVFVSNYFALEVMEDLKITFPKHSYSVISNPIDVNLFGYQEKNISQRTKILSIRPFASRKYANDLTVNAIVLLSDKPYFNELEFRIFGDGKLFDETLEPIKSFDNVIIERKFLSQMEIAGLHKQYGIFLCPTRMDSQGVSRDEAMSSGLVPITNGVTAIPEFVDSTCGILVPGEESQGIADGIDYLFNNPDKFLDMSRAAALRVRGQTASDIIIDLELSTIRKITQ